MLACEGFSVRCRQKSGLHNVNAMVLAGQLPYTHLLYIQSSLLIICKQDSVFQQIQSQLFFLVPSLIKPTICY